MHTSLGAKMGRGGVKTKKYLFALLHLFRFAFEKAFRGFREFSQMPF